MGEPYLTIEEIHTRYPDEWVLIDRPRTTRTQHVLGGYVVCHSPDYDDLDPAIDALPKPINVAVDYTGPVLDDDVEAVL